MANPSVKKLAEKTVVKIATNVTAGAIIVAKVENKENDAIVV